MATRRNKYSRLSNRERKRYTRQTLLFTFLTIALLVAIIFFGIPALVKVALFLGELRSSTQPIQSEDTLPPSPPILQPLPDATSSATIRVEGFAEEGSTVEISVNAKKTAETIAENDGEFVIHSLQLQGGENQVSAIAIDQAGNKSQDSHLYRITYDAYPPLLEVLSPQNRAVLYGEKERIITISGTTEENARVTVNNNQVITSQDGDFSYQFTLESGDNEITIIAKDRAGNERAERLIIQFVP